MIQKVEKEIFDIHQLFQEWYNGLLQASDLKTKIGQRLSGHFYIIYPDSTKNSKADLLNAMSTNQGNDPTYKIEINHLEIEQLTDSIFLASYQEWQYWDRQREPQLKIQTSSVLQITNGDLRWNCIHETEIK